VHKLRHQIARNRPLAEKSKLGRRKPSAPKFLLLHFFPFSYIHFQIMIGSKTCQGFYFKNRWTTVR